MSWPQAYSPYPVAGYYPSPMHGGAAMQQGQVAQYAPQHAQLPSPVIASPMMVSSKSVVPASQTPRLGDAKVIQNEWYDFLLYGYGQIMNPEEGVFTNPERLGKPYLTNFNKAGELSNDKQFEICAIWSSFYFDDSEAPVKTQGSPSASRLYDLISNYTRLILQQQDSQVSVLQGHRIPAGGAVAGFDANSGAFVKSQGDPNSQNLYRFDQSCRYLVPPGRTFSFIVKWMSTNLPGGGVFPSGFNPLDRFNSALSTEKRVAYGAVGIEVRDFVNG